MFQVRFLGRGGQGVVTAAELLASAAFREGRHAQALSAMVKMDELAAEFLNVESEFAAMSGSSSTPIPAGKPSTCTSRRSGWS